MLTPLRVGLLLLCLASSACNCGETPVAGDGGRDGGGGGGGGGGGTGDGGDRDGGPRIPTDPDDIANPFKDSDCDGLTDAEEFGNVYPGGGRTDPGNPDTDGDGLLDGVEAGRMASVAASCNYVGDADPTSRTLPTNPDSDGDGLPDGLEDTNRNGRAEPTETDAANPDTDFDSLLDGAEDANRNGRVDAGETDPRKRDTDGDLISDAVELNVTRTDPTRADGDGDTCPDGAEDINQNGVVDPGETSPFVGTDCGPAVNPDRDLDGLPDAAEARLGTDPANPDTDADGLLDGTEDANRNGTRDPGETNPLRRDTDCDGLRDGPTPDGGVGLGEDQNANGAVDPRETDPRRRDTDGDGITDGVELGLSAGQVADSTNCPGVPVDADPGSRTDPLNRDSDGDGIDDGAEDTNQNGRVDPGELDPRNGGDGAGPAGKVCTQMNLRPVLFRGEGAADLQLGLPAQFTELSSMVVSGASRGLIGYEPVSGVALVAWRQAAPTGATTPAADEAALRTQLSAVGAISNPLTQTFTSWDGVPALQAFYDMAGSATVVARANAIAEALVGTGAGVLTAAGSPAGPFKVQLQVLHRSDAAVVVVVALTPLNRYAGTPFFVMSDVAGGSAVAQFGDANATQCEVFVPVSANVDFLFVVDDSCSMGSEQNAVGNAATAVTAALNNAQLDWRIALVTTSYHSDNGSFVTSSFARPFTRDPNRFRNWLVVPRQGNGNPECDTGNESCSGRGGPTQCGARPDGGWVGICSGDGDEGLLGAARKAIFDLRFDGGAADLHLRQDARLVVVLLGDADDQTSGYTSTSKCTRRSGGGSSQPASYDACEAVGTFVGFFADAGANPLGRVIPVNGIVCSTPGTWSDYGGGTFGFSNCGEDQASPQRHARVIEATGGVRGAINDVPTIAGTVDAIIGSAISQVGYRMQKPPIGASVKVAVDFDAGVGGDAGTCRWADLPRSRDAGFDFDGVNRTISFYGACRPPAGSLAAVSYRYWVDITPDPGGSAPPCQSDPDYVATEPDFCRGRLACNLLTNVCECPAGCGGSGPPGTVCDTRRQVCDFVCTPDCGGRCSSFEQCNVSDCACECRQTASCPVGFRFQNGAGVCGCVCDTQALGCGATYDANPAACACVCKPSCGGCAASARCNPSTCTCIPGLD